MGRYIENFTGRQDFFDKANSYQLFFNLVRSNTYKENKTPVQLAHEKEPDLSLEIAKIPVVDLDFLVAKKSDLSYTGEYDLCPIKSQIFSKSINYSPKEMLMDALWELPKSLKGEYE